MKHLRVSLSGVTVYCRSLRVYSDFCIAKSMPRHAACVHARIGIQLDLVNRVSDRAHFVHPRQNLN